MVECRPGPCRSTVARGTSGRELGRCMVRVRGVVVNGSARDLRTPGHRAVLDQRSHLGQIGDDILRQLDRALAVDRPAER